MNSLAAAAREGTSRNSLAAEFGKLVAFVRRDALIFWSYRRGIISDIASTLVQAGLFFFLSSLIDPARMPQFGGTRASYMAFIAVGLAVAGVYQSGVGGMVGAVRNEQLMGTFEALLVTPTPPTTLQLGFVAYDLLRIPLRAGIFLGLAAAVFGVDFQWSRLGQVVVILLAFLPFVWGMAAGLTAAVVSFRQAGSIMGFVNYALLLGSGTYFPLEILPRWFTAGISLNPLALSLHAARAALLGGVGWEATLPQIALVLPVGIVTWVIGTVAFRIALERERRIGSLGIY